MLAQPLLSHASLTDRSENGGFSSREEFLQNVLLESATVTFPKRTITMETSLIQMKMYGEVGPQSLLALMSEVALRLPAKSCSAEFANKARAAKMYWAIERDGSGKFSRIEDLMKVIRPMANCQDEVL